MVSSQVGERRFGIRLSQRGAFEAGHGLCVSPGSDFTEVHFRIIGDGLHYVLQTFLYMFSLSQL